MKYSAHWLAVCLLCATGAVPAVLAQTTSGTITGIVSDQTGAVVPGAQVVVTSQATGFVRETMTSETGEYRVPLLPPSAYSIKVETTGFKTQVIKGSSSRCNKPHASIFSWSSATSRRSSRSKAALPCLKPSRR